VSVNILVSKMTEVTYMKIKAKANSLESVGCVSYRPGDPEFETIASLVTPLHKIRSEFSGKQTLYQEEKPDYCWRRNESVNDLYAGITLFTA
jgi:hypothetical protein